MLVMNSPFRELDALFDQVASRSNRSTDAAYPMAMDAYRRGDDVWVHLDLPGMATDSLDASVERGVLTITGERSWQREEGDQVYLTERRSGSFRRQVTLGDSLDADGIEADYSNGVLTLRIPVAEQAQPRKITIGTGAKPAIDTTSSDS